MAKSKVGGGKKKASKSAAPATAENYQHPTATVLLRPDAGTQAEFRKKKPPAKYKYDSSLSPALDTTVRTPRARRANR